MRVRQLNRPLVRGHVWRVRFEPWDPERDGPIEKFALILQGGDFFLNYHSVTVVLLTTTEPRRAGPTDVSIPDYEAGTAGVWATCGQVWTIPVSDLLRYEYALSPATMERIDVALAIGLGMV